MAMTIDETIENGQKLIETFEIYFPSDKAINTVTELVEIAKKYQAYSELKPKITRAKWLRYNEFFRCSNCNSPSDFHFSFCPDCGARMDKDIKFECVGIAQKE